MRKQVNLQKPPTYILTTDQREAIKNHIQEREFDQAVIAERLDISPSALRAYLTGRRGIDQPRAGKLYSVIGKSKSLAFLLDLLGSECPPVQYGTFVGSSDATFIDRKYYQLGNAYLQTMRTLLLTAPVERRLRILSDLEKLIQKYESKQ